MHILNKMSQYTCIAINSNNVITSRIKLRSQHRLYCSILSGVADSATNDLFS